MKRITVDLEDNLHLKVKIYCAQQNLHITDFIRKLVGEHMEKVEKRKPKK
jgi:hypothetical protein